MNRCQVCDKTDEDDPKACISAFEGETRCSECHEQIFQNLKDLSVNDETVPAYFEEYAIPEPLEYDASWIEVALPALSEQ
jgi:hypothetical protein